MRFPSPPFFAPALRVAASLAALVALACGSDGSRPVDDASQPGASHAVLANAEDRSALLSELDRLRQDGQSMEGLSRVRESLELFPEDALLHYHHGLLLQATGRYPEAEAAVARGLELEPAHYPSHRVLGDLARHRGAPAEAVSHFETCIRGLPAHAGCRYGLALALIDLGELDAAAEPLTSAAEQLERTDVFAELGQLERRRRRLPQAISAFSRALALDRAHLPSLLGLGQALVAMGRREDGEAVLERHRREATTQDQLDALERAAAQPGSDPGIHLQRANLYRTREDSEAAEAALRTALAQAPDFQPATLALANHLVHEGDLDEAQALISSLPAEILEHPPVRFLLGTLAVARGDESEALDQFAASSPASWPPPIHLDTGKAWQRAGFSRRAADAFHQAVAEMPESEDAHFGLALSQYQLGETRVALTSVHRALELAPEDDRAWFLLAILRAEQGDRDAARQALSKGLEIRRVDLLIADGEQRVREIFHGLNPSSAALDLFEPSSDPR